MKRTIEFFGYILLFICSFTIDRLTKYWALNFLHSEHKVNEYLHFDFVINRGISWSMFHSENESTFYLLTFVIFGVIVLLASYAFKRSSEHKPIIGEVLILAGGLSNIVDRVLYHGVIDFIVVSYQSFSWPVFNIADACIVLGVAIMLLSVFRDRD